jgi:hypothetical protein
VFLKSRAEFFYNLLNFALIGGGERLNAKLVDSSFGMQRHIGKIPNERDSRR